MLLLCAPLLSRTQLELLLVMIVIPLVFNVFVFWLTDSFIKARPLVLADEQARFVSCPLPAFPIRCPPCSFTHGCSGLAQLRPVCLFSSLIRAPVSSVATHPAARSSRGQAGGEEARSGAAAAQTPAVVLAQLCCVAHCPSPLMSMLGCPLSPVDCLVSLCVLCVQALFAPASGHHQPPALFRRLIFRCLCCRVGLRF